MSFRRRSNDDDGQCNDDDVDDNGDGGDDDDTYQRKLLWSWRHALPNHLVEIQTDNIKHCKRANRMLIHVLSFPRLLSLLPLAQRVGKNFWPKYWKSHPPSKTLSLKEEWWCPGSPDAMFMFREEELFFFLIKKSDDDQNIIVIKSTFSPESEGM